MSQNYLRWKAELWSSDTDFLSTDYDVDGLILRSKLVAVGPPLNIYISSPGYQFTATHEASVDIAGKPYSRNRGFYDTWNLQTTPYYWDPDGVQYEGIPFSSRLMLYIQRRHLWLSFTGDGLKNTTIGFNNVNRAVKVAFISHSESINNASGTRTATIRFQRKFRID